MNIGDRVRWRHDPCSSRPHGITEGRDYPVVAYDPNDRGWPDGCTGTPLVTIINDHGWTHTAFAFRFERKEIAR
jgi:hypothetical protein